eukprot:5278054-Pyramimonas_sp.AAC.1
MLNSTARRLQLASSDKEIPLGITSRSITERPPGVHISIPDTVEHVSLTAAIKTGKQLMDVLEKVDQGGGRGQDSCS